MAYQRVLLSKTLVIGIIILFIGISITPSTGSSGKASFIYKSNNPPYEPSNPNPPDGAINVNIYTGLNWTGGDPDGDLVKYDVFFGKISPPPGYIFNITSNYCLLPVLDFNTTYYWKIIAMDEHGASTEGPIWSFTTRGNDPPYEPSDPIPPDGAENWTGGGLCWTGGDPDGDDVMYDVFFGNYSPPPLISQNQSSNCTDPPPWGWFDYNTTYYWKVVAWDEYGASTSGPIWSFTTEPNYPPNPAHNPIPPDGANNVPPDAILCWNGSDPNEWDELTYDVYFGINYPPILVSLNQTETCYDPYGSGDLLLFEEYYWRIVTWDREGEFTSSPIWSFKTGIPIPPAPTIDGPTQGKVKVKYEYTFNSTHDSIWSFHVNWGDGSPIEIVTPTFPNRHQAKANHSWNKKATYNISARIQDIFYGYSEWGYLEVTIPRTRATVNSLFQLLFDRFPLLEVFLRAMNLLR